MLVALATPGARMLATMLAMPPGGILGEVVVMAATLVAGILGVLTLLLPLPLGKFEHS